MNHFSFTIQAAGADTSPAAPPIDELLSEGGQEHFLEVSISSENAVSYRQAFAGVENEKYCLVGDIRIYNRQSVLTRLGKDAPGKDCSDGALLLACFGKWQKKCLQYLVGDFAFVIFNKVTYGVFAARDHLGVRQLYYRHTPYGQLALSSSIRLLLGGCIGPREQVNSTSLLQYLLGFEQASDATIFTSIRQLAPGCYLIAEENRLAIQKYWSPKISYLTSIFGKSNYREAFLTLMETVLRERLADGRKIGLLLSGGLDSTSILCILLHRLKIAKERLTLFSRLADTGGNNDDSDKQYLEIVLAHTGMESHYSREPVTPVTLSDLFDYFSSHFRLPWSPFIVGGSPLEKLIAQHGVKDLCSGFGGDEIVSIEPANRELHWFLSGRWGALREKMANDAERTGKSSVRIFFQKVLFPLLPRKVRTMYGTFRGNPRFSCLDNSFINGRFRDAGALKRFADNKHGWWQRKTIIDPRQEIVQVVSSGYFLPPLEHAAAISEKTCRDYLLPFLDRRVIEFCLSVPARAYSQSNMSRSFLRSCMQGLLPEAVFRRESKSLIGATDDITLLACGRMIDDIFNFDSTLAWQVLDKARLQKALADLREGRVLPQHRAVLAYQLSRHMVVAAFLQWFEQKKPVVTENPQENALRESVSAL